MSEKPICEIQKNVRETIQFRLGTFKNHRFADMRIFIKEDGKDPSPTPKGLAISPTLWPQFKRALAQVEEAIVMAGWIDREDLEQTG
jgi:hypothetical protein